MKYTSVELKASEQFSHYVAVTYGLVTAIGNAQRAWYRPQDRLAFAYIALLALAFAGVGFWWQWTALRYRTIRTTRTAEDNYLSVLHLGNDEDWQFTYRERYSRIQGCVAPALGGGYARRVTVLFDGPDVYVSSIMNPARFFAPGLFSWGGISRDVAAVAAAVGVREQRS